MTKIHTTVVLLIYLLVYLIYLLISICLLCDSKQVLNVKEILEIYLIEQKIQITKMSDTSITVIYHIMSPTVPLTLISQEK